MLTRIHGMDVDVEYRYVKGYRGQRDSYGVPLEPDEEPFIEIESVKTVKFNHEILGKLSKRLLQDLKRECWRDYYE